MRRNEDILNMSNLISKKIDLKSFSEENCNFVKDRPTGVNEAYIYGEFINNSYFEYSNDNIKSIELKKTYETDNDKGWAYHKNYNLYLLYKEIINSLGKVESFLIKDDGLKEYRLYFKIYKEVSVSVVLSQFFSYNLDVAIIKNDKCIIRLKNENCKNLNFILNELKSNNLSETTKSMIILSQYHMIEDFHCKKDFIEVFVKGMSKMYKFSFDFEKENVRCLNTGNSKRKIPKLLNWINEDFSSNLNC